MNFLMFIINNENGETLYTTINDNQNEAISE